MNEVIHKNTQRNMLAMFDPGLPCNPIPFCNALADYVRVNGSDSIQDNEAQAILYTLMRQSYGEMAEIDLFKEYCRLEKAVHNE